MIPKSPYDQKASFDEDRYLRLATTTGIANHVVSAVAIVTIVPLIIQRAGMELYSTWATLSIFVGFATVLNSGLSKTIVYIVPKQKNNHDRNDIFGAAATLFLLPIVVCIICGGIVYISGAHIWGDNVSLTGWTGKQVTLAGTAICLLTMISTYLRAIHESIFQLHFVNIGFMLLTFGQYILVLCSVTFWGRLSHMLWASIITYATILTFHLIFVIRRIPFTAMLPRFKRVPKMAKSTAGFIGLDLLTSTLYPLSQFFVVRLVAVQVDFGFYDIALKIALLSNGLLSAFAVPLFSIFSKSTTKDVTNILRQLNRVTTTIIVLYVLGVLTLTIAGRPLLDLWLGIPTPKLHILTMILVAGICFVSVLEPRLRLLLAWGHVRKIFQARLVQLVIFFLIFFLSRGLDPTISISIAVSASFVFYAIFLGITFSHISKTILRRK